jgi:hypothetical protein
MRGNDRAANGTGLIYCGQDSAEGGSSVVPNIQPVLATPEKINLPLRISLQSLAHGFARTQSQEKAPAISHFLHDAGAGKAPD